MIRELPENSTWAFAGIGDYQLKMNTLGIIWDGNVRVGLEDNIYFDNPKRTQLATNIQLVERISNLAKAYGREIASPREVRKILGLRSPEEI